MASVLYRPLDSSGKPQKGLASFTEAVFNPTTHGGGLFMPEKIVPIYPNVCGDTYREQCISVLRPYISEEEIPEEDLKDLLRPVTFAPEIHKYGENTFCLDLAEETPTGAFKCFGMVVNYAIIDYLSERRGIRSTSLGGSTGDTGASSQHHAKGKKNLRSVMLYPAGRVSEYQEAQMCLDGDNLISIRVKGTDFKGCMKLVNTAFADPDLKYLNLVAPNSKSISRWLPQFVYYLAPCIYSEKAGFKKVKLSVPTGNAGNGASAIAAKKAILEGSRLNGGAVITKVHMASNRNDVIPRFYETGRYSPLQNAFQTPSSAMDVADPSNILRILAMYDLNLTSDGQVYDSTGSGWQKLLTDTSASSVSDEETKKTMLNWYAVKRVVLEPHSAVAACGLESILGVVEADSETANFFVKTAEARKFSERVNKILGVEAVPEPKITWDVQAPIEIENEYKLLKNVLLSLS